MIDITEVYRLVLAEMTSSLFLCPTITKKARSVVVIFYPYEQDLELSNDSSILFVWQKL